MRIAIAGAGIAGLTAAIALAKRGLTVDVYERAPRAEDVGAGIQLSPNAMAVLQRLGIRADIEARLVRPESIDIADAVGGALLTRIELGAKAEARYGAPYCLIHRGDLHGGLMTAIDREPKISLYFGAEVRAPRTDLHDVTFEVGGTRIARDVLVAADGVHSAIRAACFKPFAPKSLGKTAWRATLPLATAPERFRHSMTGLWLGRGFHVVHYPVSAGQSVNVVLISALSSAPAPPRSLLFEPLRELIDAATVWRNWPLLAVNPARPWSRGRIVLIGDAAHAMAPSAAQGGAQAIEDAWMLAAAVSRLENQPIAALTSFEHARRPRLQRIFRQASRNLAIYNLTGPAALLRNVAIRSISPETHLAGLDWLYGWKPA